MFFLVSFCGAFAWRRLSLVLGEAHQILAVFVLYHRLCHLGEFLLSYPSLLVCNLLQTSHLLSLAFLDNFDECACLRERVVRAGVEPCETALQGLHLQFAALQILLVHGCYLQFAACARLDVLRNLHHAVRVEVEAHHRIVALRVFGLLLDAEAVALGVELSHAVAFGVVHVVAEDGRLAVALHVLHALAQQLCEAGSVEYVVAQYEACAVVADKLFADDERA